MHPSQEKAAIREAMKARLSRMNAEARASESRSVVRRLESLAENARVVCAYAPLSSEVDITALLETLSKKRELYLPLTDGKDMEFRRVRDLHELKKGAFGILEPLPDADRLNLDAVDLVLVPGMAFDRNGGRTGRGNGGYDRWIKRLKAVRPEARCMGVAFEQQLVNAVPMEDHDARLDGVVTARGLIANNT